MSGNAAVQVLEELSVYAPLGIRFRDPVSDEQIRDGLRVTAWPTDAPGSAVTAHRTRSDIYAFQRLPGLRSIEYPREADPAASPPLVRRFAIQVEDTLLRFLPAGPCARPAFALPRRLSAPQSGTESTGNSTSRLPVVLGGVPPSTVVPGRHLR